MREAHVTRWASGYLLAVLLLGAAPAHAGTIVFDFEDGTQGWGLTGSFRQETDVLNGGFAIFGTDGDSMTIELDLTDVSSLSFTRLFTGLDPRFLEFVGVRISAPERPSNFLFLRSGVSLIASDTNPHPNPDIRWHDLSDIAGVRTVVFSWNRLICVPEDIAPCLRLNFPGYVDDITFHTIPEPSALGMLVMGGLVGAIWALRIARPVAYCSKSR